MITKITGTFQYNGLFVTTNKLPKRKQTTVEIIGVPTPVDPGFVRVRLKDASEQNVPTCVLLQCPSFDFEAMLSPWQIKQRDKCGFLFGSGSRRTKPGLIPLKDCKIKTFGKDK